MDALNTILGNLSVSESIYDRLYAILGCSPSNTDAQISHEYRFLALRYHPDRCIQEGGPSEAQMTRFAEIQLAYGILGNTIERTRYDAWLNSGLLTPYPMWRQITFLRYAAPDLAAAAGGDQASLAPSDMDTDAPYQPPMLHWAHSASLPSLTISESHSYQEGQDPYGSHGTATCIIESNDVYAFPESQQLLRIDHSSRGPYDEKEAWIQRFRSYDV